MDNNEIDDGLTPEERAAIASDDDIIETDDLPEDPKDPADPEDPPADPEDNPADPADPADPVDPPADPVDTPADPADVPAPTEQPVFVAQVPADAEAKLADIASKKEALITQFDDGDITAKEYQRDLDALMKEERQIEQALLEAQIAAKMEQQRQVNEWNATVGGFIAENPRYDPKTSPRMYKMLDAEVREVANSEEFKNRTDSAAGRLILQRAHENLAKELGFEVKPAGKQQQKVPKPTLPPSLHTAPAAEASETSNGKWAVLDRLQATDPVGYEEALMKLSDRDREAYLSA